MPRPTLPAIACAIASLPLGAQYRGEPPAIVQSPVEKHALSPAALGVDRVWQVHLVPHSSLAAGVYYAAATVSSGATPHDVVTGTFDSRSGTYTGNSDAIGFNTATAPEINLTISDDLRVAVFERSFVVHFATRAGASGPFGPAAPVGGLPPSASDAAFGRVNGRLSLFFIAPSQASVSYILLGDFDATTGTVSNVRRAVTLPVGGSMYGHSVIPLHDGTGETRALVFAMRLGFSVSEAWFSPVIDDSMPPTPLLSGIALWLAHGDANGGTIVMARDPIRLGSSPAEFGIAAMSAATVPTTGGRAVISCFAPVRSPAMNAYSVIPVFGLLAAGRLPIVGVNGMLSLNPLTLVTLPPQQVDRLTGVANFALQLPPAAPGTVIHCQPLFQDLAWGQIFLGNTAQLLWR